MVRNEDILKDILLKMNYDPSKSLNENIEEQMGEKPWMTPRGMTYDENLKALGKDSFKDVDIHNVLAAVEIGSMIIAPFTGPFAPVLYGVSIAAGMTDAAVYYYKDKDPHSALMMAALTIIPEGKLIGRGVKNLISKYGKNGALDLVKLGAKGELKGEGKIALSQAMEDIAKNGATYSKLLKVSVKETIKETIKNKPLKWLVLFAYNLSKFGYSVGVNVAGVYIGADQLYLHYYGDDADRQKSDVRKVADIIANYSKELWNSLFGEITKVIDEIPDEKLDQLKKVMEATEKQPRTPEQFKINKSNLSALEKVFGKPIGETDLNGNMFKVGDDKVTFYNNGRYFNQKTKHKGNWKISGSSIIMDGKTYGNKGYNKTTLTIEDIKNGKGYVKIGDEGDIVKLIQTELDNFGYEGENGEPIFKGNNPDGKFGPNTKFALKNFQKDYGIKDDGIVGKDTISALTEI